MLIYVCGLPFVIGGGVSVIYIGWDVVISSEGLEVSVIAGTVG